MSLRICVSHATQSYQECAQYVDQGSNKCLEYRDNGFSTCGEYRKNCCTWFPCNILCEIASFICVAFVWVVNMVCVVAVWVASIVCVAWTTISLITCILWSIIEVIIWPVGLFLNAIFQIPLLGRLLKNAIGILTDIGARIASAPDAALTLIGIKKLKRINLEVLIMKTEKGVPVIDEKDFMKDFISSRDILKQEANIQLHIERITTLKDNGRREILDVSCNAQAFFDDILHTGSFFERLASQYFPLSALSSNVSINPRILVFVVRDIDKGATAGCSLFSNTNYITINGSSIKNNSLCKGTLAHEIGHKCGLLHVTNDIANLMWSNQIEKKLGVCSTSNAMYSSQVAWVRMSKYVTS